MSFWRGLLSSWMCTIVAATRGIVYLEKACQINFAPSAVVRIGPKFDRTVHNAHQLFLIQGRMQTNDYYISNFY